MSQDFTDAELEAYLDEALDPDRAAELEQAAREIPELVQRLSHINRRRDAGIHTLGEIWRRYQIGVPSRDDVSQFLLNVLPAEHHQYIEYRLDILRCPYTIAILKDLQSKVQGESPTAATRREKFYKSSAGLLKPDNDS